LAPVHAQHQAAYPRIGLLKDRKDVIDYPDFLPLMPSTGLKRRMSAKNKKFWILAMARFLIRLSTGFSSQNKLWCSRKALRIFK